MNEAAKNSPAPRKRRAWLRVLVGLAGVIIVLLVVAYFILTSSGFFKGVILPRVSQAIHAQVTVSDASISPFSEVVLHNLKVQTTGTEPLMTAPEIRVRYRLMDILGGRINLDEASVSSPTFVLIENPDKTSNLDPILKSQDGSPASKGRTGEQTAKAQQPLQLDIKKVTLTDVTVRRVRNYSISNRDIFEASHLNLNASNIKNGQSGKLEITAEINLDNRPVPPGTNALLQAKLGGSFDFTLMPDLKPGSVKGKTHLQVGRAEGAFTQLADLAGDLECEVSPTELKQVAVRFQKGNTRLGELAISGPFDITKSQGQFDVQVSAIDKQLLNALGARQGIDFGSTTLSTSNHVELSNAGQIVAVAGQMSLARFQLIRTNQTTPPLDLLANYDLKVDNTQSNVLLRALSLRAKQKQNEIVKADLTSPMVVAWGNSANALGDSAFNFSIARLDLSDWQAFLGSVAPAGLVSADAKVLSQQGGKQLSFNSSVRVEDLSATLGSNRLSQVAILFQVEGQATEMRQFKLVNYKLQLVKKERAVAAVSGSGTFDSGTQDADMQLSIQATLARVLELMPQPDLAISSGVFELKGHLTQKQQNQSINGNAVLSDFSGKIGKNELRGFGTTFDLDASMSAGKLEIRKALGQIVQLGKPGGRFDLTGTYNSETKAAHLDTKLTDWNANGLSPFLEPALGGKKLSSLALNSSSSIQQDAQGNAALKGDLQITNLIVNDPKGTFPAAPLSGKLEWDVSLDKKVADLRLCRLTLTPTSRAANQLQLTGQIDLSRTNVTQGHLKLTAESLDVTTYYDLFAAPRKTNPGQPNDRPTSPATAPSERSPQQEPEPVKLPVRNFTAEANIGRFYLHEVQITNFIATTKIDGGHVVLKPFQLSLNGAPVNATADLDLSIPGYNYDTSLSAQAIPLAPLVNTFQPERKGQVGGTLTASAKINGMGITGANLQKNLKGQFEVSSTNLNLSVVNIKNPLLRSLINVIATLPDLVKNPVANVGNLLQGLTGASASKGGLADELEKSPVNAIALQGDAGSGKINLQRATVQSAAFQAEANGTIALAPVLTNSSVQIPVMISLSRSIAERVNMLPPNTPTNAVYAKLPDFLTVKGTVGKPDPKVNAPVLAGIALQGIGGGLSGTNKIGQTVQSISSLLTGRTDTNSVSTNRTGNDANALIQGLGGLLGGAGGQTNQAGTNQNTVNDLLNNLLGPKK